MRWLVHVIFNVCTKYEFSIFNRSEIIRGPKISKLVTWLKPRPFRGAGQFFTSRQRTSCCVLAHKIWSAYPFKSYEGVPNFKFRSRDLTTPTLGPICCALASTCHDQCVHQIWSFYLWSFQRYKGGPEVWKLVTWPKQRPIRGQIFILRQRASRNVLAHKIWSA